MPRRCPRAGRRRRGRRWPRPPRRWRTWRLARPAGICTIDSSESRPCRCLVGIGTPSTGTGVRAASMPGRCAAPPAPAMMQRRPRVGGLAGEPIQQLRGPVGRHDPALVGHVEMGEPAGGRLHDDPVGIATHDDAYKRGGHRGSMGAISYQLSTGQAGGEQLVAARVGYVPRSLGASAPRHRGTIIQHGRLPEASSMAAFVEALVGHLPGHAIGAAE